MKRLDVEMEAICFDPSVPSSVNAATERVAAIIDSLLVGFKANPILGPLAHQLKSQYLDAIQCQVAQNGFWNGIQNGRSTRELSNPSLAMLSKLNWTKKKHFLMRQDA